VFESKKGREKIRENRRKKWDGGEGKMGWMREGIEKEKTPRRTFFRKVC